MMDRQHFLNHIHNCKKRDCDMRHQKQFHFFLCFLCFLEGIDPFLLIIKLNLKKSFKIKIKKTHSP
jgi:hypothetical protein